MRVPQARLCTAERSTLCRSPRDDVPDLQKQFPGLLRILGFGGQVCPALATRLSHNGL